MRNMKNPFKRNHPSLVEVHEDVVENRTTSLATVNEVKERDGYHPDWALRQAESRGLSNWMGGIEGYNIIDPLAIPPPGMGRNRSWAGVNVNEHTMLMSDAVMTALRIITNGVNEMGNPYAYTDELSDNNRTYRKWADKQPKFLSNTFGMAMTGNIEQPQYIGMEQTIVSMGLYGEAIWYVLERARGSASAVEVLNPALFAIEKDSKNGLRYWYGQGAERKELNPNNIIFIPHKIMPSAARGLSTLDYLGINTAIAIAALNYGSRWFSQGISPGYILTTDQKLGVDEVERVVQTIMIQHGGANQAHLPLLIDSGLKPTKNQATPDEAQYLQTLEYQRSVVASYFGIPTSLLGNALERQTPMPAHTIGEEMQRMMTWTLSGYITPLEQIYTSLIAGKTKVSFNRNRVLQSDAQSFAAFITAVKQSNVLTPNEIREEYFDKPPHPDGDQLLAPLASNTAPEQTENNQEPSPTSKSNVPTGE